MNSKTILGLSVAAGLNAGVTLWQGAEIADLRAEVLELRIGADRERFDKEVMLSTVEIHQRVIGRMLEILRARTVLFSQPPGPAHRLTDMETHHE